MLIKSIFVAERAESFVASIQRELQKSIIDNLQNEIDKIEDKIFSLKDFTLQTNVNAGMSAITRETAINRFKEIINLEYDLKLMKAELAAKKESFDKYFGAETEAEAAQTTQEG